MKHFVITTLLLAATSFSFLSRADVIVMQDGSEKECKVIRISESEIIYTLPGQDVERTVDKASVFKLRYDNGTDETINPIVSGTTEEDIVLCTGVRPTFKTDYSHLPPASREYKLFDYYNENGVDGIVVEVADNGRHGKIISLSETYCRFAERNVIEPFSTGGVSLTDGEKNHRALSEKLATNSTVSPDDFPAHKWATSLGEGWYIPSYGEMLKIIWLIASKDAEGKSLKKLLNKALKSNHGKAISSAFYGTNSECESFPIYYQNGFGFFSSCTTKLHKNGIYVFNTALAKDVVKSTAEKHGTLRTDKWYFRAFHKF